MEFALAVVGVLLAVSELLVFFPKIASNSVYQLVVELLKKLPAPPKA